MFLDTEQLFLTVSLKLILCLQTFNFVIVQGSWFVHGLFRCQFVLMVSVVQTSGHSLPHKWLMDYF